MAIERINTDVAIVGGGLAGLCAARLLARAPCDVAVLEARLRLGGRLESHSFADGTVVDLGGQWFGPGQDRILALTQELDLATHDTFTRGRTTFEFQGRFARHGAALPLRSPLAVSGAAWAAVQLSSLARQVGRDDTRGKVRRSALDSLSLADWICEHVRPGSARTLLSYVFQSLFCCDPSEVSLALVLYCLSKSGSLMHMIGVNGGAQERQFSRGAQHMTEQLVAGLGGCIHLGKAVARIVHRSDGAVLSGPGFEVTATRVVIAIPPPLISHIDFSPGLHVARAHLLSRTRMGAVVKCVAVYARPFWREQGLSGETWSVSGPINATYDTTPPRSEAGTGVLTALASASSADVLSALPAHERRAVVLSAIARQLGPLAVSPLHYADRAWAEESWTRGGYAAHVPAGAFSGGFDVLRASEGVLHWAGTETATAWPGYMEGAIESGQRAAREILGA